MAINPGKGTLLYVGQTGASTNLVGQITSLVPYGASEGVAATEDLDDTWRRGIPTVGDGGELQLTINYDPTATNHARLTSLVTSPTTSGFRIIPGGLYDVVVGGIITNFTPQPRTVDGLQVADITIKLSGEVTFYD